MKKLEDLTHIRAQREALSEGLAELKLHLQKFERTDEDVEAAVSAVTETLESLGRVRTALMGIGEAAQVELLAEASMDTNSQSNRSSSKRTVAGRS
jgi:hypothetical protein